jgi:hypothetical protein
MNTMEQATKLNSMQLFMVKMFEKQLDIKQEREIKQLLADYFSQKIDEEMDNIWMDKKLSQEDLDHALQTHKRTKY